MKVISSESMRTLDARTIKSGKTPSLELMERAGLKCTEEIKFYLATLPDHHKKRIFIICGPGNNAGDGFVIARHLMPFYPIKIICTRTQDSLSPDAKTMIQEVSQLCSFDFKADLSSHLERGDIIIDCLFGTGLNRPLKGIYESLVSAMIESQSPIISVDSPSGLLPDGSVPSVAVKASLTLSIGLPKKSYFYKDGPAHLGALRNLDITFPAEYIAELAAECQAFLADDAKAAIVKYAYDVHKYSRGQCLIIAGSENYSGAPLIAAECAAVSGAGMVILANGSLRSPQNPGIINLMNHADIMTSHFFAKSQSVLIGPGLENNSKNKKLFSALVKSNKALVIDATAIDFLAENKSLFPRPYPTIITPHTGELKRLAKALDISEGKMTSTARLIAQSLSLQVILKGPQSQVFDSDGKSSFNTSGNWVLSTAGSGDALAGIIASLWAHKDIDYYQQAKLACFIHGLCAELYDGAKRSFSVDQFPALISKAFQFLDPLS
jgi:ADP-dependent NAD(P)H-hydrate dehydratase / NAD(P)H-hydrate epimerase